MPPKSGCPSAASGTAIFVTGALGLWPATGATASEATTIPTATTPREPRNRRLIKKPPQNESDGVTSLLTGPVSEGPAAGATADGTARTCVLVIANCMGV